MAPLPGEEDPEDDLDSLDAQEVPVAIAAISKPKKKSVLTSHSKVSSGVVLRKKKNTSASATSTVGTGTTVAGALKTKKKMVLMR